MQIFLNSAHPTLYPPQPNQNSPPATCLPPRPATHPSSSAIPKEASPPSLLFYLQNTISDQLSPTPYTSYLTCVHAWFVKHFDCLGRIRITSHYFGLQQLPQLSVQLLPEYLKGVIPAPVPGDGEVLLPVSWSKFKGLVKLSKYFITYHRHIHRNHHKDLLPYSCSIASLKYGFRNKIRFISARLEAGAFSFKKSLKHEVSGGSPVVAISALVSSLL